jgi:IS605 OrfB family transposase
MNKKPQLTQRAYTLRLKGIADDKMWRERLWKTHEAVNRGAKAFGDWLLTFRGGLDHKLASEMLPGDKKPPDGNTIRDRRVILALSWLSVESKEGAPGEYIVQSGETVKELESILKKRGLDADEIESWKNDCKDSLTSPIRDDAVWVNRSNAFDNVRKNIGDSLARNEIWDLLGRFFIDESNYLSAIDDTADDDSNSFDDEKPKDLVQKAGGWLSNRFGTGKGADFSSMAGAYRAIAEWVAGIEAEEPGSDLIRGLARHLEENEFDMQSPDLSGVLKLISGPGYKSATRNYLKKASQTEAVAKEDIQKLAEAAAKDAEGSKEKTGGKGPREWAGMLIDEVERYCGFTYISPEDGKARHWNFSVMLDHAARKVSVTHSWIKLAESERRKYDEDCEKLDGVTEEEKKWLNDYCLRRTEESGSIEEYRIRPRAKEGWGKIVEAWSKPGCDGEQARLEAARALQDDPEKEIEKFGDIQLFEALAADDAKCVWIVNGKPDPRPLLNYVAATHANYKKRHFKVPAYRHPDPLLHPIFCDFGNSRWDINFAARKPKKDEHPFTVTMDLYDNGAIVETKMLWQSKRLVDNLNLRGMKADENKENISVSRADRLGLAAARASENSALKVMNIFEEKHWNGRLQAPRAQFEGIAAILKKNNGAWNSAALKLKDRIQWFVTLSPKLQVKGPWIEFAREHGLKAGKKARPPLYGLAGMRLLSVDLGHRYAASCAVWETLSQEQMLRECEMAGQKTPTGDCMYLHLKTEDKKCVVYRRVGPDVLPNRDAHPAPWARLDRQFLVKLQGENEEARKASPAEISAVKALEIELGASEPEKRDLHVDELMSSAVRTVRLALKRHADCARISFNLITDRKYLPGGREAVLSPEDRVELLTGTLVAWCGLAFAKRWKNTFATSLWESDIKPLLGGAALSTSAGDESDMTPQKRRAVRANLEKALKPVVEKLAADAGLRKKLHDLWREHWNKEDALWKQRLRRLRDWILPRVGAVEPGALQHVGGLSLTRISTIRSLYQVQKAFFTRLTPKGRQMKKDSGGNASAVPQTADEGFGRSILETIEKMRENRVKQLASRIAEAALGVGIEKKKSGRKDIERPRQPIVDKRFAPCHAIVIENLKTYRPDELMTRRENRQLMSWSSAKVQKYLSDACELNGIHLREVSPAHTSRQDSRTGAPGVRCKDVTVADFLKENGWWHKERARIEKKKIKDARDCYILELCEHCLLDRENENRADRRVRVPKDGGEIFVSADPGSPAARGLQADLNAAANIGLAALLDPDWPARWWRVPCSPVKDSPDEFAPEKDKTAGSAVFKGTPVLKIQNYDERAADHVKSGVDKKQKKEKKIVNLWRDASSTFSTGGWRLYKEYKEDVLSRVIAILREQAGIGMFP